MLKTHVNNGLMYFFHQWSKFIIEVDMTLTYKIKESNFWNQKKLIKKPLSSNFEMEFCTFQI